MAKTTRAGVNTSINTNCATNGVGAITAATLQLPLKDLKDSALIMETDIPNVVFINVVGDFGTPAGNVYSLTANTTYIINGAVAMGNARLTGSGNISIMGWGLSLASLVGTPAGGPMLTHTGSGSLYVKDLSIDPGASGQAFALSGSAPSDNATFDSVRVVQQGSASTIASRGVVFFDRSSFAAGPALTLLTGGTVTSLILESCGITVTGTTQTGLVVQSGVTIQSRIRVQACSFNVSATCTGINVDPAATIPVEGLYYTLTTFAGAGTATAGVGPQDVKTSSALNRGLADSVVRGFMFLQGSVTPTPIAVSGTYVKMEGTTSIPSPDVNSRFTHSTGRLTYTGADPVTVQISVNATLNAGSTETLRLRLYRNGNPIDGSIMETTTGQTSNRAGTAETKVIVELQPNDYVEPYVTNMSSTTSVVVSFLQMTIS